MSHVLPRLLVAGAAAGTALVLASGPAGAATSALSASPHSDAKSRAGGTAAQVDPQLMEGDAAARASVGFRISGATCYANDVAFTADTYETGFSGIQRFRQKAQLQQYTGFGWANRSPVSTVTSVGFANDGRSMHFVRDWDGNHVDNGASWRVLWQGSYLNGFGGVVAKTRQIAITCA